MKHIFFDFDSTLVTLETLDEAINLTLKSHPEKEKLKKEIEEITNKGMAGELSQKDSILERLKLASLEKEHLTEISEKSAVNMSQGIEELVKFLHKNNWEIYIVSGGFHEMIYHTADKLKIKRENCFANKFIFDENNNIIELEKNNPLSGAGGKHAVILDILKNKKVKTSVFVGDGMADLQTYEKESVQHFCGYGVNVVRKSVQEKSPNFFTEPEDVEDFLKKLS